MRGSGPSARAEIGRHRWPAFSGSGRLQRGGSRRGTAEAPEPQAVAFEDAFEVGKGHFDLLCARGVRSRKPRCWPRRARDRGHLRRYRAGPCVMAPSGSTRVSRGRCRNRICAPATRASCPRAPCPQSWGARSLGGPAVLGGAQSWGARSLEGLAATPRAQTPADKVSASRKRSQAGAAGHRVIRDRVLQSQTAEPAIGQIDLDLRTRADAASEWRRPSRRSACASSARDRSRAGRYGCRTGPARRAAN